MDRQESNGVKLVASDTAAGSAMTTNADMDLSGMEYRLQQFRSNALDNISTELQDVAREMMQEVARSTKGLNAVDSDREHGRKVFKARDSVLTYLLTSMHIQTLYNIFVAILIIFAVNTVVSDYLEHGRLVLNFSMLQWSFGQLPIVITVWIVMFVGSLVVYPIFLTYVNVRSSTVAVSRRVIDFLFGIAYLVYVTAFLMVPVAVTGHYQIPPGSSIIVICEQVRMIMKMHSFLREATPRVLAFHREAEANASINDILPGFSQYLYFLFCPTLLYRDHYPRMERTRWGYVISNLLQVAGCLLYVYYIFVRFCVPVFSQTGKQPWNTRSFVLSVMSSMLPSTMVFILGFFSILHSWLNAFAEMMGFADRMFYKDWWNCRSWAAYYRKWNVVVHDWLHAYVYSDVKLVLPAAYRKSRTIPMFTVFVVSAMVHEYVLAASFGFFFPVLLMMFGGIGVSFVFLTNQRQSRIWNVFMWVMLFFGNGVLMCFYSLEFYSRENCSVNTDPWLDLIIPRVVTCQW